MAKKLTDDQIQKYYEDITRGKIGLNEAADNEGISDTYLKKLITEYLNSEKDKKSFQQKLYSNKYYNTYIKITSKILENVKAVLLGEKTIRDASKECNMNEETFKDKIFEAIENDSELLSLYLKNGDRPKDYSQVNTKLVIINMLKNDMSQTKMAHFLGMPVRTLSNWVNRLPEEDKLKRWAKESVYRTRRGIVLSEEAKEELNRKLDEYIEENNIKSFPIDTRSIEERELEKVLEFLKTVYELEGQTDEKGRKKYTRKGISKLLKVGNSAIRRAEIKRDKLELIVREKNKQKEGEEK